jgi:hypothetical protein
MVSLPRNTRVFTKQSLKISGLWLTWAALSLLGMHALAQQPPLYDVHYHASLEPDSGEARVSIRVEYSDQALIELRFRVDPERHHGFAGDGELRHAAPFVYWRPPAEGGEFRLSVRIERERGGSGSYDAFITPQWALLRADHLFPAARARSRAEARSRARLSFDTPPGWSVETRYGAWRDAPLAVEDPTRRYVRPTGWILAGELGVRREEVVGREVTMAAPQGSGARRMDALAMIRWTLPTLLEVFPNFPDRLLVVSAGDPMWRGALSGPASLYIHVDRPMINERGTSTLVHELVHVAGIVHTGRRAGWIVEGLADYYSLEVLRRAGVISEDRHAASLQTLARRGEAVRRLDTPAAGGPVTARAVLAFVAIDQAIRAASEDRHSLDDVARELAESDQTITYRRLREVTESLVGHPLEVFDELPLGQRNRQD